MSAFPFPRHSRWQEWYFNIVRWFFGGWAVASVLVVVYLWINHATFPLNLDIMDGTVLQHFRRAAAFQPIYPAPTPAYVPLAYNPLYYVIAVPFSWLFGTNLLTLRLVAIFGMAGSALMVYLAVRDKTKSAWWGLVGLGLFAAAYRVMDAYLDTAHSDSWLVFSALLGTYLIDRNKSRWHNLAGIFCLTASFWFKQHGALFLIGGLTFLAYRDGVRRSIPYWLLATVLGPLLYVIGGPQLLGSHFLYFTWQVPQRWSELNLQTIRRVVAFAVKFYPVLATTSILLLLRTGVRTGRRLDVWQVQLMFACLSGMMGALDPGSSNNVFIPMGTWFITMGAIALFRLGANAGDRLRFPLQSAGLAIAFITLLYNPLSVAVSPDAAESYSDLIRLLRSLPGIVYAPTLGQLQDGYEFYPTAHWVALEDMIRGPGPGVPNHPLTRTLLEPALHPKGAAYILANYPLEVYPWITFLDDSYVLDADWGDRFRSLTPLPRRWESGWPRYLYRYDVKKAASADKTHPQEGG